MRKNLAILAAAAGLLAPISVSAGTFIQTGTINGMTYKAQSRIVGQTSTATIAAGGNPIYFASAPKYSGVAALIMNYSSGSSFICSGSLMNGGAAIVTAAHCVAPDATKGQLLSTTAYFGGGASSDDFFNGAGTTAVGVNSVTINPLYTGEVIDQNDIAVLGLSALAPIGAQTYDILTTGDLTGEVFNVAGYGARSDAGGSVGANIGIGRLRQGENSYDFRFGDSAFGGFFTDVDPVTGEHFFGTADIAYSFLSDFDNGNSANDAACLLGGAFGNSGFCDLGRGALEVSVAGGDSGGPQFINGKLASVTSYGLSFGSSFGDIDGALNSSFGEFNGFVPTYVHESFIRSAVLSANSAIPEPSTWMVMIFGFAMVGSAMRRRPTAIGNASLA